MAILGGCRSGGGERKERMVEGEERGKKVFLKKILFFFWL